MIVGDMVQISVRADASGYRVSLTLIQDGRFGDPRPLADAPVQLRREHLLALSGDVRQYGASLTAALFGDRELDRAWGQARAQAQRIDHPLQVRVQIEPSAGDLHRVRWETLCDPLTHELLALSRRTPIVRFIPSAGSVPFVPAIRDHLRALVVIAAAAPPQRVQLPPINAVAEQERIASALGAIPHTFLGAQVAARLPASLANLRAELQRGYDILYLVCHGMLAHGQGAAMAPYLWLESEQCTLIPIQAQDLTRLIADLDSAKRGLVHKTSSICSWRACMPLISPLRIRRSWMDSRRSCNAPRIGSFA